MCFAVEDAIHGGFCIVACGDAATRGFDGGDGGGGGAGDGDVDGLGYWGGVAVAS